MVPGLVQLLVALDCSGAKVRPRTLHVYTLDIINLLKIDDVGEISGSIETSLCT
jgi:hypothetical protein